MSSEDNDSFEERFSDQARKKALEMFDHPPEPTAVEYDFKEFFTRILSERDWTDKLESAVGKVRNRFHPRSTDTELPEESHDRNTDTMLSKELKALIPDMKEVAKAYDEMTTGYKEFIQNVIDAKQFRGSKAKEKVERGKSTESLRHSTHRK